MTHPTVTPDLRAEPWAPAAKLVRERGQNLNPYRLGVAAGELGIKAACPYALTRSRENFKAGFERGQARLRKSFAREPGDLLAKAETRA